jgi:hypothetical protein
MRFIHCVYFERTYLYVDVDGKLLKITSKKLYRKRMQKWDLATYFYPPASFFASHSNLINQNMFQSFFSRVAIVLSSLNESMK